MLGLTNDPTYVGELWFDNREIKSALIDHRTQKQSTSIEIGLSQSAWKRIRRSFLPKYVLFLLSLFFSLTISEDMSKIERQRKGEEVWRTMPQPPHRPRIPVLVDRMSFRGIYHWYLLFFLRIFGKEWTKENDGDDSTRQQTCSMQWSVTEDNPPGITLS